MKRLLAVLLPSESREHVLGDLAERSYRARDIAGVLPRVWWSAILRLYTPPAPSFAGATEEAFEERVRKFSREADRIAALDLAILSLVAALIFRSWFFAGVLLLPMLLRFLKRQPRLYIGPRPHKILGPRTWRGVHAELLVKNLLAPVGPFVFVLTNYGALAKYFGNLSKPERTQLFVAHLGLLAIAILLNIPWMLRVQRERRALKEAEPA